LLHLAQARTRNLTNKHIVLADAENLPFKSEMVHHTVSVTVIQNTPNKMKLVEEMERVTKYLGTIIISAHRKTIKQEELEKIFRKTNLHVKIIINDSKTNDIISITEKIKKTS
jgi:ubiquinone/menaquinone biosynthesis C-methylase UbiE